MPNTIQVETLTRQNDRRKQVNKIQFHECCDSGKPGSPQRGLWRIRIVPRAVSKASWWENDVETEDGLVTLVDKEEIEAAVVAANHKEKLLQARDTPLRQEPLRSIIGERMEYDTLDKLLRGQVQLPSDMEEGTRLWFEAIQENFVEDEDFSIEWTTREYFENWAKMSEDKSSLPGIHAAHIKCVNYESEAGSGSNLKDGSNPTSNRIRPKKLEKGN